MKYLPSGRGRVFLTAVAASAALVLCHPGTAAAQYPPAGITVNVTTGNVTPGQPTTVTIGGCNAGDAVTLEIIRNGVTIRTVDLTANGNGQASTSISPGNAVGTYTTRATCSGATVAGSSVIRVVAAGTTSSGTGATLVATGANVQMQIVSGAALVIFGGGMVVASRNRRRATVPVDRS